MRCKPRAPCMVTWNAANQSAHHFVYINLDHGHLSPEHNTHNTPYITLRLLLTRDDNVTMCAQPCHDQISCPCHVCSCHQSRCTNKFTALPPGAKLSVTTLVCHYSSQALRPLTCCRASRFKTPLFESLRKFFPCRCICWTASLRVVKSRITRVVPSTVQTAAQFTAVPHQCDPHVPPAL
jgi:hypothetical protein